ncbi:response regulator transcription factor [Pedobacter metabolipauper]|uniref:Two-component system alkaline phosphatase synthesis response regulator PhoP n=1 Tax=Pedobacter metabolipauper TaxID=425513 RepID=A0A4R6SZ85_9SPHI|nr:response regulator transcription factor [Pedobacter metabolipauper]TDQ11944.1 two-component system alkaline phosphatase synthesis response regulator PhoP [Pedobacter metabolipauper]
MDKVIYVVEDDDDIRFIIEYILIENGYLVQTFATAKEFHDEMEKAHPDLILLDVMLPDANGMDICRALKTNENTRHITLVIMSAHAAEKAVLEEACADDFISKPFDLDEMVMRIQKLIGR